MLRTTDRHRSPDYARSYWTPPLTPRLAFDLERRQIEDKLQMWADGFDDRPRHDHRADAAADDSCGEADSGVGGVDGAVWGDLVSSWDPQPAERDGQRSGWSAWRRLRRSRQKRAPSC